MINRDHNLSVSKQCAALGISRGSVYYEPVEVSASDLALMRRLASDITYIPMARGFLYLAGVMDWFARRVLAWRLSITLGVEFCIDAVDEALHLYGRPEIFNSGQGSQFTSDAFTDILIKNGVAVSMDGKGSWRDNVFVERFWRTLKYEEVYLKAYESVAEARMSIGRYLEFYNPTSEHPSLYVVEGNRFC
jgi:putative transposase